MADFEGFAELGGLIGRQSDKEKTMRILLVEDNADHRELMSLALTGHDPTWLVEEVASGEEALRRLAEEEAYELVFLDYSLPQRNGLEVLKQIRRGEAPPPVVMVTGRGDEQVAVRAMKAGAYDYVAKGKGYLQRLPVAAQRAVEAYQLAMDRKRAEEEIRQRTAQLDALRQVGLELTSQLHLDVLLRSIVSRAIELLGGTSGGLYLYRPEEDVLEWAVSIGPNMAPTGTVLHRDEGLSGRVWETGTPLIVDDYRSWEERAATYEGYPFRAVVGVPVRWSEEFLGVLNVLANPPRAFSPADVELLSLFAQQAAIAIENARLFEELEERRMYLEGVLRAAPDAIVTLGAHHRIVEWNSGAERLFGYSREEVIGQNLDHLITNPDVFEEAVGFTQIVMVGKDLPPVETVRYRKDGSPVDVIVAGSPILVGDELIGVVAVYTDITARKRMEEALRALALVDDLTGLYNRRGFFTMSQQQLKMADRTRIRMALLFADFDDLKHINDTLGHPEGDRALIEVADVFKETFRESDIIARIAGDEFVVLAIETDSVSPEVLATRLQENLEASNARLDRQYKLSLSIGTARYDPERPCLIDELLTRADRAMYEKKQRNHQ
jgi:diguanylate cyclase (GGDEF)-like protein/PAS domain S-box-containing protein